MSHRYGGMTLDLARRATLDDVPQMVALAADRVPGEADRLDEQLTAYLTDPETCAGFVVVEPSPPTPPPPPFVFGLS